MRFDRPGLCGVAMIQNPSKTSRALPTVSSSILMAAGDDMSGSS
jgi:hypothetical protein